MRCVNLNEGRGLRSPNQPINKTHLTPCPTHTHTNTPKLRIAVGPGATWTLSEDKEDRKWGLWVQGLFEEPKVGFGVVVGGWLSMVG